MEKNKLWCATGVSIRSSFTLDIYINDLRDVILSIFKTFADKTSLFPKVINTVNSENTLNADLNSISNWAFLWKMQFNPDPEKQANEAVFSLKSNTVLYPPVIFNNNSTAKWSNQKHLSEVLDSKLDFNIHIEHKIKRYNNTIGLLTRLSRCLPRKAFFIIDKSFILYLWRYFVSQTRQSKLYK